MEQDQSIAANQIRIDGLVREMHNRLHVLQQLKQGRERLANHCWNLIIFTHILLNSFIIDQALPQPMEFDVRQHPVIRRCDTFGVSVGYLRRSDLLSPSKM